jgi:hypothetical protein
MRSLLILAAVSVAAVFASTPAHADPHVLPPVPNIAHERAPAVDADKAFMGLLAAIPGLTITNPKIVEQGARNVCSEWLEAGRTRADT